MGVRGCHPRSRPLFLSIPLLPPLPPLLVSFARSFCCVSVAAREEVEEKGALDDYSAGKDAFEEMRPTMHARNGEEFPETRERSSSISKEEGI